jgi:branched-chain amino acid aminotransferase
VADGKIGKLTKNLYDTLTGIQTGILDDPYGWRVSV